MTQNPVEQSLWHRLLETRLTRRSALGSAAVTAAAVTLPVTLSDAQAAANKAKDAEKAEATAEAEDTEEADKAEDDTDEVEVDETAAAAPRPATETTAHSRAERRADTARITHSGRPAAMMSAVPDTSAAPADPRPIVAAPTVGAGLIASAALAAGAAIPASPPFWRAMMAKLPSPRSRASASRRAVRDLPAASPAPDWTCGSSSRRSIRACWRCPMS